MGKNSEELTDVWDSVNTLKWPELKAIEGLDNSKNRFERKGPEHIVYPETKSMVVSSTLAWLWGLGAIKA